jgi:hypothetical protein
LRISCVSDKKPPVEVSRYRRVVCLTEIVKEDHQGCQKYVRYPNLSLHDTLRERILNKLEGSEFPLRSESLLIRPVNSPLFVEPVASCLHGSPQRVLILRQINPLPLPVTIFIWLILILYSHIRPCLSRNLFPSDFPAILQGLIYNFYIFVLLFPVSPTFLFPNLMSIFRFVGGSKETIKFWRVPELNQALYCQDVRESEVVAPQVLNLITGWRWITSFVSQPLSSPGDSPRWAFSRRLDGPQTWSGHCGGSFLSRNEPKFLFLLDSRLGGITPTWQSQLLFSYRFLPCFLMIVERKAVCVISVPKGLKR